MHIPNNGNETAPQANTASVASAPAENASSSSPVDITNSAVTSQTENNSTAETKSEPNAEPATILGTQTETAKEPEQKNSEPTEGEQSKKDDATSEVKQDGEVQSDEPAPLPTYEQFTLPEGTTFDEKLHSEFTKELGEFQLSNKVDQKMMQEFGQKLVNRHIAEVQNVAQRLTKAYNDVWEKQKSDWFESFQKDPDIGGERAEATTQSALQFIKTHGGNEQQQNEFRKLMNDTGLGNHPALIRLFANAMGRFSEGKPLPGTRPTPGVRNKIQTRYGNSN